MSLQNLIYKALNSQNNTKDHSKDISSANAKTKLNQSQNSNESSDEYSLDLSDEEKETSEQLELDSVSNSNLKSSITNQSEIEDEVIWLDEDDVNHTINQNVNFTEIEVDEFSDECLVDELDIKRLEKIFFTGKISAKNIKSRF